MSLFDAEVHEGYPTTGLFQSYNGRIYFGGYPIIRIDRATLTVSQGLDTYYEVGERAGIVYTGDFDVRGNISRAYVNGAEWRLAIGMEPSTVFDPGEVYADAVFIEPVASATEFPGGEQVKNVYPIKTRAEFHVNARDKIPPGFELVAEVDGVIINTTAIRIGAGGDLIRSGPIDWIGEKVKFRAVPTE